MSLRVYNVLTRQKEDFIPIDGNNVKIYACGITTSGDAHIGHAYQAVVFDMIRKYLEYRGYNVNYVRNYTDVDDKIIIRARELGINPKVYAEDIMKKTDIELSKLFIDSPTIQSKATECIEDMIDFIEKLIDKGHAYATENGDVFFDVGSFKEYGKFSNRTGEDEISGVRKEVEPGKRDDKDFALWKNAKDDEIYWDSPWGPGRPGWHIECSAMSMKYLGETIDIHGGGKDLLFPHHENEIAQSESLTGKQFSKYWIHNGLIKINGEKMGKSLGNSILIEDLLKKYNPEVIRMVLFQNNYKSDMNIVDGVFEIYEEKLYSIYKLFKQIDSFDLEVSELTSDIETEFVTTMDNDFNTSAAISNLLTHINTMYEKINNKEEHQWLTNTKSELIRVYKILELLQQDPKSVVEEIKSKYMTLNAITEEEILESIDKRNEFKKEKKYTEADAIRDELLSKGIALMDSREGTDWDISF